MSNNLESYKDIWVIAEVDEITKKLRSITLELLSAAKKLSQDLRCKVGIVIIGQDNKKYFEEFAKYGADIIYNIEDSSFTHYDSQNYAQILIALTKKYKPEAILYPSTYMGRDLAPRVASKLSCGLTADCTAVSVKEGKLVQSRPAFGGNIMADIICPDTRPQMASVRPNILPKIALENPSKPQIIEEHFKAVPSKVRVIKTQKDKASEVLKPEEADIVIAVGRGVKDQKTFAFIKELAAELGAALGATRPIVENGLLGKNHQIGQSGVSVKPKVYISFGISGALQHTIGMHNSDLIIAVNSDGKAPIFNISQYGFVADVKKVVPQILQQINKLK
ncbi:MAG: electron transfer flavoprotein subunit alpha/FixB family protein [Elusimicrobiaceae bacterium]|nr:electron transfer flavoprotein subunit alpha/FixB family protein [Elusimicrobiaceae bacterium]